MYVVIKDEFDEDEAIVVVTCVNKNDRWIIDNGCLHHMIREKSKFITLNCYEGNSVRFGNDAACLIKGKGSIKLTNKILCDNAYYVRGLNYNLLIVTQMNNLGCMIDFENKVAMIYDTNGELIRKGDQTRSNLFYLDIDDINCLVAKFDDTWLWHKRLCHLNFDNLIKISHMKRVRGLPKLKKPKNIVCKQC